MVRALAAATLVLLSGCAGLSDPLAELPEDDKVFSVLAWGCGLQAWPWHHVLATYSNATLVHLLVEKRPEERRYHGPIDLPKAWARRVLSSAEAVRAVDGDRYEPNPDITHGERSALARDDLQELRRLVARADRIALEARYEESGISDGCSYDYSLWGGEAYFHVYAVDDSGPKEIDDLREFQKGLHTVPAGMAP